MHLVCMQPKFFKLSFFYGWTFLSTILPTYIVLVFSRALICKDFSEAFALAELDNNNNYLKDDIKIGGLIKKTGKSLVGTY